MIPKHQRIEIELSCRLSSTASLKMRTLARGLRCSKAPWNSERTLLSDWLLCRIHVTFEVCDRNVAWKYGKRVPFCCSFCILSTITLLVNIYEIHTCSIWRIHTCCTWRIHTCCILEENIPVAFAEYIPVAFEEYIPVAFAECIPVAFELHDRNAARKYEIRVPFCFVFRVSSTLTLLVDIYKIHTCCIWRIHTFLHLNYTFEMPPGSTRIVFHFVFHFVFWAL